MTCDAGGVGKKKDVFQVWMRENRFCAEAVKPVQKPFEDLSSCFSIFKSPSGWLVNELAFMKVQVKKPKAVTPPLEGLRGCNLFTVPTTCTMCSMSGHNSRTCPRKLRALARFAELDATRDTQLREETCTESHGLDLILDEPIQDDEHICEVPALPRPDADTGTPRIGTDAWTEYLGGQLLGPLEGLAECASMFREPNAWSSEVMKVKVKQPKEIIAPLEGLRGCPLFTIPTTCGKCCLQGHDSRSCSRTGLVRQFAVHNVVCA